MSACCNSATVRRADVEVDASGQSTNPTFLSVSIDHILFLPLVALRATAGPASAPACPPNGTLWPLLAAASVAVASSAVSAVIGRGAPIPRRPAASLVRSFALTCLAPANATGGRGHSQLAGSCTGVLAMGSGEPMPDLVDGR